MPKILGTNETSLTPQERMEYLVQLVGGPVEAARITAKTRTTIDNWRRRGSADLMDVLPLVKAASVSLDWLATGAGQALLSDRDHAAPSAAPSDKLDLEWLDGQAPLPDMELTLKTRWPKSANLQPENLRLAQIDDNAMAPIVQRGAVVMVDIRPQAQPHGLVLVAGPIFLARRHYVMPDGKVELTADADPNWRFSTTPDKLPRLYPIVWVGQAV